MKESQAARFADLIEGIAGKARALSVDRLARAITLAALGLGAALLVLVALIFACLALFRLLAVGVGVGVTAAYAIFGGLFLAAGWLSWRKRSYVPEEPNG